MNVRFCLMIIINFIFLASNKLVRQVCRTCSRLFNGCCNRTIHNEVSPIVSYYNLVECRNCLIIVFSYVLNTTKIFNILDCIRNNERTFLAEFAKFSIKHQLYNNFDFIFSKRFYLKTSLGIVDSEFNDVYY